MEREKLASRLGFILLSAGCAIGLGNIWRFPYITGQNGGAIFVLIYLVFLVILGIPVMSMEFSVGRASQRSAARSFHALQPAGKKWHIFSYFAMGGNYLLMMFYTTVSGWILAYLYFMITGRFNGLDPDAVGGVFGGLISSAPSSIGWMIAICIIGFAICAIGLQKGVERITKFMMSGLVVILIVLIVRALTLPGAGEGLAFYLKPNPAAIAEQGIGSVLYAAMGQAFFTLSLGIGSMAIFGSYLGKERSLMGEAINVTILDTCIAFGAGLLIFPASFAFGIDPGAGPGLIFVTLPNVFNSMPLGQFWGVVFFIFMVFAALSTVIAVFENILAFAMDIFGVSRRKAALINAPAIIILSLPCALSFNLWANGGAFLGLEDGWVLDIEDFVLSNNLLPLGALIYLAFCVYKTGWGWDNYVAEANTGAGIKVPKSIRFYLTYILPIIMVIIFVVGYINFF